MGSDGSRQRRGDAHFRPEFINRLDDIVRFTALSREQISEIVDLQLQNVIERVGERGVQLEITSAARELLWQHGLCPLTIEARPLRRVIQKQLVDRLALALLAGRFHGGEAVVADAVDGQVSLEPAEIPAS